ncbi:fibroblast growth factor-binding protein 1 [Trichomycterus rosablanca]|uniref:fibroblast growth factor-binding protein 1 n=1 Tax=Trichomycterus rosablanca TaxID=2290929 RepID=UPI002F357328
MQLDANLVTFLLLVWVAHGQITKQPRKTRSKGATRGKFTWKDQTRCTWTASGEKLSTLKVTCGPSTGVDPDPGVSCEYTGEPSLCPGHSANPKAYWRQITRALQKQERLCSSRKPVRARMCKGASPGAHFRLVRVKTATTPRVNVTETMPTQECTGSVDHQQLAEEKCGESWASFCNFFFTLIQSSEC